MILDKLEKSNELKADFNEGRKERKLQGYKPASDFSKPEGNEPMSPAKKISKMHDYTKNAVRSLRIFRNQELRLPESEHIYIAVFKGIVEPGGIKDVREHQRNYSDIQRLEKSQRTHTSESKSGTRTPTFQLGSEKSSKTNSDLKRTLDHKKKIDEEYKKETRRVIFSQIQESRFPNENYVDDNGDPNYGLKKARTAAAKANNQVAGIIKTSKIMRFKSSVKKSVRFVDIDEKLEEEDIPESEEDEGMNMNENARSQTMFFKNRQTKVSNREPDYGTEISQKNKEIEENYPALSNHKNFMGRNENEDSDIFNKLGEKDDSGGLLKSQSNWQFKEPSPQDSNLPKQPKKGISLPKDDPNRFLKENGQEKSQVDINNPRMVESFANESFGFEAVTEEPRKDKKTYARFFKNNLKDMQEREVNSEFTDLEILGPYLYPEDMGQNGNNIGGDFKNKDPIGGNLVDLDIYNSNQSNSHYHKQDNIALSRKFFRKEENKMANSRVYFELTGTQTKSNLNLSMMNQVNDLIVEEEEELDLNHTSTYKGQYLCGQRHGFGHETTSNGSGYLGFWFKDMKHGLGRIVMANGNYFHGEFRNNNVIGKGVFFKSENGVTYVGDFLNNQFHGFGTEYYGYEFMNNLNGYNEDEIKAKKFALMESESFEDQLERSMRGLKNLRGFNNHEHKINENYISKTPHRNQKRGKAWINDGNVQRKARMFGAMIVINYLNGFIKNKEDLTSNDALSYLPGDFEEHGKNFSQNQEDIYTMPKNHIPATKQNIRSGKFKEKLGSYYEGLFVENKKHGEGKFVFDNGDVYIGEFMNDLIHGEGVYKYKDGRFFTGTYVKNLKQGKGYFELHDGIVYEGDFNRDLREGQGKLIW